MERGVVRIHQKLEEKFKPKRARFVRLNQSLTGEKELQQIFESLQRAPPTT